MLSSLSLGTVLLLVPALIFLYAVAVIVLIPYMRIRVHKKKGVETYFFPLLGIFKWTQDSFAKYEDVFGLSKQSIKENPDQKYFVSNVKNHVVYSLRDPQYVKELLQKPQLYLKSEFFNPMLPLVGNGLVFAENLKWKSHRRFVSRSFHYEFLKSNLIMIQDTTREFFDKLTLEDLTNYKVISRIQEITGEIVGRIFFGKNLNNYSIDGQPLTLKLAQIVCDVSEVSRNPLTLFLGVNLMNKLPFLKNYHAFLKRSTEFRNVCRQIVQTRRAQKVQENDFLGMLLLSQESDDLQERYSDEDIIDEFITFFIAGMDTTGHLIGMTLYNLAKNPEYLKELEEERNRIYNKESKVTGEAVQHLDVLHLHLKETLRHFPPAPTNFFRKVTTDHKIFDIQLKKGDYVQPEYISLLFNPKYFENPTQYNPNRWRDSNVKIDPYAYTPFSAGPRNCIGQHLAIIEAKIIISEFLNRFNFKLKDGYKLRMTFTFLHEPKDELMLDLSLRNDGINI